MTRFQTISGNIARHVALTETEFDYFKSLLRYKKVSAKTLVLKQGEECNYFYYVVSGALRACYRDKNDKESTIMFAMPDWWITDMYSFVNGKPAMLHIETLADSELLLIGKSELSHLYEKLPKFERYFRILMQNAYTREQLRIIENLSLPALGRYSSFIEKYPQVAALITQKQLASYLGVSPEFLSAVKGKKSGGT